MPIEREAATFITRVQADTAHLRDTRGALAQRPQIVLAARTGVQGYGLAPGNSLASQLARQQGSEDGPTADEGARQGLDAANAGIKQSAADFLDAREGAQGTLDEAYGMGDELEGAIEEAQERMQTARQARFSLYDRTVAAENRLDNARDSAAGEPDFDRSIITSLEGTYETASGQLDRAYELEQEAQSDVVAAQEALQQLGTHGVELQEELEIANSPTFEGWDVDGDEAQQELRRVIDEVEGERQTRRATQARREQARADNRANAKSILAGGAVGGLTGGILGAGLGTAVGAIAGTFLGSTAIGAGVGAAAGGLLGGLAGAGIGALYRAFTAPGERQQEAAQRAATARPQAQEGTPPPHIAAALADFNDDNVSLGGSLEGSLAMTGSYGGANVGARQQAPRQAVTLPADDEGIDDLLRSIEQQRDGARRRSTRRRP